MKLHLFKLSYWESGTGKFYVGDVETIGQAGNQWWCAARLLGLSPSRFIAFLLSNFNAKIFGYKNNQLIYYFENETSADTYCKYINKKARQAGFYV